MNILIGLQAEKMKDGTLSSRNFAGDFYEAEIDLDLILSYPWLREHALGVFPHLSSLASDQPEFTLLHGWARQKKKGRKEGRGKERVAPPPARAGHKPAKNLGKFSQKAEVRHVVCEKAGVLDQFPPEWDQEIDLLIKKLDLQLPPDEQKMPLGQREQPLKKAELKHIRRVLQKIEKLDAPDK